MAYFTVECLIWISYKAASPTYVPEDTESEERLLLLYPLHEYDLYCVRVAEKYFYFRNPLLTILSRFLESDQISDRNKSIIVGMI